jgi:hypothetical protein
MIRGAIQALAESGQDLPHLPKHHAVAKRSASRPAQSGSPYDVNNLATQQELRSFVRGQCHVECVLTGTN